MLGLGRVIGGLIFFVLLLCLLVVNVGRGVIRIHRLVVVVDGVVVILNVLVVLANSFVVVGGIHAIGVGGHRGIGQGQTGISQRTLGRTLIVLTGDGVVLIGLLVVFDDRVVGVDDVSVGFLHILIDSSGLHNGTVCGVGGAFGIHRGRVSAEQVELFHLSCMNLCGEGNRHCHSDCGGAADLTHVILLCHYFFLLSK